MHWAMLMRSRRVRICSSTSTAIRGLQALSEPTGFARETIFSLRGEPHESTEMPFQLGDRNGFPQGFPVQVKQTHGASRDPAGLKTPGSLPWLAW
jgi:hypothetical protein